MHVAALHPDFAVVFRQVFRHAFSQRGDQHSLAAFYSLPDFVQQVVNLAFHWADFHRRIDKPGRPDDLLNHNSRRFCELIRPRRR